MPIMFSLIEPALNRLSVTVGIVVLVSGERVPGEQIRNCLIFAKNNTNIPLLRSAGPILTKMSVIHLSDNTENTLRRHQDQ
jgi:hypothetical protein